MKKSGSLRRHCEAHHCKRIVNGERDFCPVHFHQLPSELQEVMSAYVNHRGNVSKHAYKLAKKAAVTELEK